MHPTKQFARKNALMVEIGEMVPGFFTGKETFTQKSMKSREFLDGRLRIAGLPMKTVQKLKNKMIDRKFVDVAEFDRFISTINLVD